MVDQVYYHHPENDQYSLAYVTREKEDVNSSGGDAIIERYDLDEGVFVLYTNRGDSGTVDDIDQDFDDEVDRMPHDDRIITVRLLQVFEEVVEEKRIEEDEKLELYKEIEIGRIPDAINRVDWSSTAVDVAGQLTSTLVLKHALPNANHRTAIAMAEWYLESSKSGYSVPNLAMEDFGWMDWVDEYIAESKRILTVRRNTKAFSLLQEWGCDTIERKGAVTIDLETCDLDYRRSEALREYAERHTELCTDFMAETVERAGHEELLRSDGATKAEFVTHLEPDNYPQMKYTR